MSSKKSKTISSISPTTSSVFVPHNIPDGYIRGDRLNALPLNFEVYAVTADDKSKVKRVTANLNPKSRIVSFREGHSGVDWNGSILKQPINELKAKDLIIYRPEDNNRIEEFLANQQATARGKKKTNKTKKYKSRKNKTKKHHRKIK